MEDLDGNLRLTANAEGLIQRGHLGVTFIAHVRGIDAAETRGHPGKGDQLFRAGVGCGRVLEGARDPHGSLPHALLHQLLHLPELVCAWRPVAIADDHFAHGGCADVRGKINAHSLLLEAPEILAERVPVGLYPVVIIGRLVCLDHGVVQGSNRFALAGDLGGDPLEYLGGSAGIHQQSQL